MTAHLIPSFVGFVSAPPLPLSACTHTHTPLTPNQLWSYATPNYSEHCQNGGSSVKGDGSLVQNMTASSVGGHSRKGQSTVSVITVIHLNSGRKTSALHLRSLPFLCCCCCKHISKFNMHRDAHWCKAPPFSRLTAAISNQIQDTVFESSCFLECLLVKGFA